MVRRVHSNNHSSGLGWTSVGQRSDARRRRSCCRNGRLATGGDLAGRHGRGDLGAATSVVPAAARPSAVDNDDRASVVGASGSTDHDGPCSDNGGADDDRNIGHRQATTRGTHHHDNLSDHDDVNHPAAHNDHVDAGTDDDHVDNSTDDDHLDLNNPTTPDNNDHDG